jgi:hypothetical protein
MSTVRVPVGTRKGAFILTADGKREQWEVSGPVEALLYWTAEGGCPHTSIYARGIDAALGKQFAPAASLRYSFISHV